MRQLYKKLKLDKKSACRFNKKTLATMREALLIAEGTIPANSFSSVDELLEDLNS